jgi:hypothetical protein
MKNSLKILKCVSFFIFFIFHSCSSDKMPIYESIANEITLQVAKKLMSEHQGLHAVGTGGGMIDDVKFMMIGFNYYSDEIDVKKGRALLVECTETFLKAINSNEKIRPYLHNYPFLPSNIEVEVFCYKQDRHNLPDGTVCIFSTSKGNVEFISNNPKTNRLQVDHEEPYEEALRIVKDS